MTQTYIDAIEQKNLEDMVARTLEYAAKQGSIQAEVALSLNLGLSVSAAHTALESIEFNKDRGLSITVYNGHQKGSASTNDLSDDSIQQTVQAAVEIASHTDADPCAGLPEADRLAYNCPDLALCYPAEIDPDEAVDWVLTTAKQAAQGSAHIKQVDSCGFNSNLGLRVLGNSHGFLKSYPHSRYSLGCVAIGEQDQKMERDYDYHVVRDLAQLDSPEVIAKRCVEKTINRLGSRMLSTQTAPIIFSPEVAVSLINHFNAANNGHNLYRNSSFLSVSHAESVFPDWFQLEDNPLLRGGLGSAPFDGDGVQTKAQSIVKNGYIQTHYLSTYAARRLKLQPTGHTGNGYNLKVHKTLATQAELLNQVGRGFYVTDLMGQGVNLVTGDYSRGASGFWVEDGEIQFPVSEVTIAGKLPIMLRNILAISDDPSRNSSIDCGSLAIESMQIAGN